MTKKEIPKLLVTFSDGRTWAVPLSVIAENYAKYYWNKDKEGTLKEAINRTLDLFEGDAWEALEWAQGNMDWKDVEQYASLYGNEVVANYHKEWINADMEVID